MLDDDTKCAHPACQCARAKDSEYCSSYCESAGADDVEISCDCGHIGCELADSLTA
jgi:hypothetical protein